MRFEIGTQPPATTLEGGGGTCRDYALLMMEAARSLGLAARFITGYLYDPAQDKAEGENASTAFLTFGVLQGYRPAEACWCS